MPTKNTPKTIKNRFPSKSFVLRGLMLTAGFALCGLIIAIRAPRQPMEKDFRLDEPAPRSIYSPSTFAFVDEIKTENLRRRSAQAVPDVYDLDLRQREEAEKIITRVIEDLQTLPPDNAESFSEPDIQLSEAAVKTFLGETDLKKTSEFMKSAATKISTKGVVSYSKKDELLDQGVDQISIRDTQEGSLRQVYLRSVPTSDELDRLISRSLELEGVKDRKLRGAMTEFLSQLLGPNLALNAGETELLRKEAEKSAAPVIIEVKKDEMVVQRGRIVTGEDLLRIREVEKQFARKQARSHFAGILFLVFTCFIITLGYLLFYEKQILAEIRKLSLFISIVILSVLTGRMVYETIPMPLQLLFLPGGLASLLLALLMRPQVGVLGALVMPVFFMMLSDFRTDITLMTLAGSLAASYAAMGIRKRSQFLRVGACVGAVNMCVLVGHGLLAEASFSSLRTLALYGFLNGFVMVAPTILFLLAIFEHAFNVTTDISLLELCDLNHPLLKRMMLEAPGTYYHSQVVARLGEAAAGAIGANGLLTRVGCYFHDIGKMERSGYFIENQEIDESNKHESLAPSVSGQIITGHVREGIELGRKYKLKDVILDFIPQHQGTTPVYYFYRKALEKQKPGEAVRIDEFRYPGPKPQSKETAIAMLADSVEAASRTLKHYSNTSARELVTRIINEKYMDGQLEECNLTFTDLNKIAESFTHSLIGIYHSRIEYPEKGEETRGRIGGPLDLSEHQKEIQKSGNKAR